MSAPPDDHRETLLHRADIVDAQHQADVPATARRPYRAPMRRSWFLDTGEYRAYALREFSSVIVGLFVFDLIVGVVAAHRGPDSWHWWVDLQRHPLNLALSLFALIMAIVHATTWFRLTPKVIRLRRGQHYLPDLWLVSQNYALLTAFAVLVLWWLGGLG